SGNALSFVMQYEHREFLDSLEHLATKVGLSLPETSQQQEQVSRKPLYDILEEAALFFEQQLQLSAQRDKAHAYLTKRGLDTQTIKDWRIGYAPAGWDNLYKTFASHPEKIKLLQDVGLIVHNEQRDSYYDAMRDRVIFPIRDSRGRVIAFGGRVLDDSKPKYLNSPESPIFHKGEELYGFYESKQAKQSLTKVMVVEGYLDVIAVHQAGFPFAVATLGTATSTTHIERIFKSVPEVVFCFDGDNAGQKAAWRALESALPALKEGVSAQFLFLPNDHDPDSLIKEHGAESFANTLKEGLSLADFLFNQLTTDLRLDSLEGKSRLASLAKPLIEKVPVGVYRQLLWQRLSQLTGLDEQALKAAMPIKTVSNENEQTTSQKSISTNTTTLPKLIPRPKQSFRGLDGIISAQDWAIQILIQNPNYAQKLDYQTLSKELLSENSLLINLIHFFQENPNISIPATLGAWAGDTEEGKKIRALINSPSFSTEKESEQTLLYLITQLKIDMAEYHRKNATGLKAISEWRKRIKELEQIKNSIGKSLS
ncbi:MAG: DNA primase, partial [Pseudomonadales bacterium]|nr:DNA primase [Pseudomonadales bacterium]